MEEFIKDHAGKLTVLFFIAVLIGFWQMNMQFPEELRGGAFLRLEKINAGIYEIKQDSKEKAIESRILANERYERTLAMLESLRIMCAPDRRD